MHTAASGNAAAPSAGRRILISSSSSFSPAATPDEAVPDMAVRAASSPQPECTHTHTYAQTYAHTHKRLIETHTELKTLT